MDNKALQLLKDLNAEFESIQDNVINFNVEEDELKDIQEFVALIQKTLEVDNVADLEKSLSAFKENVAKFKDISEEMMKEDDIEKALTEVIKILSDVLNAINGEEEQPEGEPENPEQEPENKITIESVEKQIEKVGYEDFKEFLINIFVLLNTVSDESFRPLVEKTIIDMQQTNDEGVTNDDTVPEGDSDNDVKDDGMDKIKIVSPKEEVSTKE